MRLVPFPLLISLCFVSAAFAQQFEAEVIENHPVVPELSPDIHAYSLFRLNTKEVFEFSAARNDLFTLKIDPYKMRLFLWENDVRSDQFRSYIGEKEQTVNRNRVQTFHGYTDSGGRVALTFDDDYIEGLIEWKNDWLIIAPIQAEVPGYDEKLYIIYRHSDDHRAPGICGVDRYTQLEAESFTPLGNYRAGNCYNCELSWAADSTLTDKFGTAAAVQSHHLSIMNSVNMNWDDEFADNITYRMSEHYVATGAANSPWAFPVPPATTIGASTMLNEFGAWAPTGFSLTYDLGIGRTNVDLTGSTVGIAWTPSSGTVACNASFSYQTHQDYTGNLNNLRCLMSHELGHNFSANHISGCIMNPSVNGTNCWSPTSVTEIETGIDDGVTSGCFTQYTTGCNLLPVELIDFSAEAHNTNVYLKWSTASESGFSHFILERRNNRREFSEIAQIEGAGISNSLVNYAYIDRKPVKGTGYYRLKQVDLDGTFEYSRVIVIESNRDVHISFHPNPAKSFLSLDGPQDLGIRQLRILNSRGKVMTSIDRYNYQTRISIANYPKGTYIITGKIAGRPVTRLFVKH